KASSVALVTHVNPDGDGLGAEAALAEALEGLGKKVFLANQDATPERYAFLGLERWKAPERPCDLGVVLDTSDKGRTGTGARALDSAGAIAVVDHHAGGGPFGQVNWIDASAASAGSMVARILEELQVALTPSMASAIYTALAHDTGCFKYSNTGADSFSLAARLKSAGADTAEINTLLFDSRRAEAVKLTAKSLSALQMGDKGLSAMASVSAAMLAECGAAPEDCDGIVEALRGIQGVEVSALLRQDKDSVKLSLRSKRWLDVNRIAGLFGGGGHVRAAGATLRMPLNEAFEAVAARIHEALAEKKP
ncbi:MAG: bifunctional oligoribonuclease/PAP phosphatase NrnA, partial [candidate division FCPU426 bacterium]